LKKKPFKDRYQSNNDCVLHIRLTDAQSWNPGLDYYINAIQNIVFDNLYIASDDFNHSLVKNILQKYPNAKLIKYAEVETIQFASTCKYVVTSRLTFSTIIGYLAFFSNVLSPLHK